MVRRAAASGAEAVGFWAWYDDLGELLETVDATDVVLAYLSGGSQSREGLEFPLTYPAERPEAVEEIERAIETGSELLDDLERTE